ncbi:orotidine 5-phosphate decarboxylase [Roseovarius ramblicola]|uniref:Orotidine 5-phosphate decarboxylase n=1 Tax=Roseovarius ramblicola TaxID=2022336 RepID=A0ABV5HWY5_9RHOB
MRPALLIVLMTAMGGPPAAAETRLGPGVSLAHGSYSTGGGMTVATELRRTAEGKTALCGAWAESGSQSVYTKGASRSILSDASVYSGGTRLLSGLGLLPKIAPRLDYAGVRARCIALDLPWRAGRVPEVFLPRQVISPGTHDDGGHAVRFQQSGPGALGGSLEIIPVLRRQSGLVRLSSGAVVAGGHYTGGGGLRVAAEIVPVSGRAHLCGAWSDLPGQVPQTEGVGRALLHGANVTLGAHRLDIDAGDLRRVRARHDYTGTHANCLDTGLDWHPALARETLRLHLPARVVYRSTTPEGTRVIRFVPSSG